MSDPVAIVQRLFCAFRDRDVEALRSLCAPEMVFEPITARLASCGEPYRGTDGMQQYLADVERVWDELDPAPDTYLEGIDGVVVATGEIHARAGGRRLTAPAGWLWRVRDSRVVYGRVFETPAAALSAGGLG